jgi:pheromone shutdown protein TraB
MNKIPVALAKRVTTLQNLKGQLVYVLGTAHVSKRSEAETRELILQTKPKAVFVELCEQRRPLLDQNEGKPEPELSFSDQLAAVRTGQVNLFTMFYKLMMKMYNLTPGGEFRAAAAAAKDLGVPLVLGDRIVGITIMRFWKGMTFWDKLKLFYVLRPRLDDALKGST